MDTTHANRVAIGDRAKAVREALLTLGMRRCSLQTVYNQAKTRPLRLDWYGLFWRFFRALWLGNRAGAEFLYEDFKARVEALRVAEVPAEDEDWRSLVCACSDEHAEAIREAIVAEDYPRIVKESAEAVTAYRRLIAAAQTRALKRERREMAA